MADSTSTTSDLIIRARDLASEPLEALVKRIDALNTSITAQSKLSERGQTTTKALSEAIRAQGDAVKALLAQQGRLEQFYATSERIDKFRAAQEAAGEAVDAFREKLAAQDGVSKAQEKELQGLISAYNGAGRAIRYAESQLALQGAGLAKLGIDTKQLAAAQEQLTVALNGANAAYEKGAVAQLNFGIDKQRATALAAEATSAARAEAGAVEGAEAQAAKLAKINENLARLLYRQKLDAEEAQAAADARSDARAVEAAETRAARLARINENLARLLYRQTLDAQAEAAAAAERQAAQEAASAEQKAERLARLNQRLAQSLYRQQLDAEEAAAGAARRQQAEDVAAAERRAERLAEINQRLAQTLHRQQLDAQEAAAAAARRAEAEEAAIAGRKAERLATLNQKLAQNLRRQQLDAEEAAARAEAQRASDDQAKAARLAEINQKLAQSLHRQQLDAREAAASAAKRAEAEEVASAERRAARLAEINQKLAQSLYRQQLDADETATAAAKRTEADQVSAAERRAALLLEINQKLAQSLYRQQLDADAQAQAAQDASERRRAATLKAAQSVRAAPAPLGQSPDAVVPSTAAADALARLLAPAALARSTLAGVTAEIERVQAAMATGAQTTERYQGDLRTLAADRSELTRLAGLIDAYTTQEVAVRRAKDAYDAEAASLNVLRSQAATVKSVDEDLERAVNARAAATNRALAALEKEDAQYTRHRAILAAAGVDYRNLGGEMAKIALAATRVGEATKRAGEVLEKTGGLKGDTVFLGLKRYELINLSYQINDVFTSLSSGISLYQTAAQQGGQIFQIFERSLADTIGRVRGLAAGVGGLPVVFGAAAAAAVALGVGIAAVAHAFETAGAVRSFEAQLASTADQTITTGARLTAATQSIQRFGSSFADAKKAVDEFLAQGLNPARLVEFGKTAQNVADITGKSLPDAAKEFAGAFNKGFDAVVELDRKFHFLTETTYDQIKALYEEKGAIEGGNAAYALFAEAQQRGADKAKGEWSVAIRGLTTAWHNFLDALSNSNLVRTMIQQLTELAGVATTVLRLLPGAKAANPAAALSDNEAELAKQQAEVARLGAGPQTAASSNLLRIEQARLAALTAQRDVLKSQADAAAGVVAGANVALTDSQRALVAAKDYADKLHDAGNRIFDPRLRGQAAIDNAKQVVDQFAKDEKDAAQKAGIVITQGVQDEINKRVEIKRRELAETIAGYKTEGQVRQELDKRIAEANDANLKGAAAAAADARRRNAEVDVFIANSARELHQTNEEFLSDATNAKKVADLRTALEAADQRKRADQDKSAGDKRLNAEEGLQAQLLAIKAKADSQDKTNLDARLRAIDEEYGKIELTIEKAKRAGVSSVGGQSFSEFVDQIEAQKDKLKSDTTLTFYEEKVNALLSQRKAEYQAINEELAEGTISVQEAFRRTSEVTSRLGGEIRKAAGEAAKFAGALPNQTPKVQAFEAKNERYAGQSDLAAGRAAAEAQFAAAMKPVNDLIRQRTELEAAERTLAKDGIITNAEAETRIKAAYDATTPKIQELTDGIREQIGNQQSLGEINDTTYQTWLARLDEVDAKARYVSDNQKALYKAIGSDFASGAITAIDAVAQKLGQAAAGGAKLGDVFRTAESAFANFAASFLKQIAEMILRQQLLAAVQAGYKALGGTGELFAAAALVAHEGAVVGSANDNVRRPINPEWFRNAPRFHEGGIVGLAPDERAAILQTGEQVLSRSSVRDAARGAAAAKGAAEGASRPIRQVLVFDPSQVSQALAGSHGEEVVLTHIRNNAGAVRQIVR